MSRSRTAALAAIMLLLIAAPAANAAKPAVSGILPAGAGIRGHSLTELSVAYSVWSFGTGDGGPTLGGYCEQSPIDSKIWFLPVSVGSGVPVTCNVPQGAYLFMSPGGSECSNIEGEPWFGEDDVDLLDCVNETFLDLTYVELTVDGKSSSDLDDYIFTTPTYDLPADNLLSSDPGISRFKAYFVVIHPLSRGTHTIRSYDEFDDAEFIGEINYTINVR